MLTYNKSVATAGKFLSKGDIAPVCVSKQNYMKRRGTD